MLLYIYKVGVHWYFRFAVKTADNRDKMLKYTATLHKLAAGIS